MQQENEQLVLFQESSSGKMSEALSHPTTETISKQSSTQWQTSGRLNKNGLCWTLNTSECPIEEGDYSLSVFSVLMPLHDVPIRYYLSKQAASGVLRRAEKRSKSMPTVLREALKKIAEQ